MLRHFILTSFLFVFLAGSGFANDSIQPIYTVQSVDYFKGDRHGEFKQDLLVSLNDGTQWKVHPKDTKKFQNWHHNDALTVRVRTSFYWFKREHKFEFYNKDNYETVSVMLIEHNSYPYRIMATDTYCVGQERVRRSWEDANKVTHYYYEMVDIYHKMFRLNDGSHWVLTDQYRFKDFTINESLYLGYHSENGKTGVKFFFISGNQREAVYAWVYPR